MVMKAVQKRKGAEAIKEAKKGKQYRRKNKSKLNKAAKQRYKTMTPAEKLKFHARQVFTKAMRHGATEAEAKKVVAAWKKRRKHRAAGSHAAGQKREVTAAQRQIREQIRKKSLGLQSAHQKALSKIRSAKVAPAKRAAMRQAEKTRYANERKNLASERTKAAANHKKAMAKIKPKGKFSLKSLISNFKAKPISSQGKRLVDIGAKAAKDGVARIAAKHFGTKKPAAKKAAGGVTKKAPKAAAPAAAAPAAAAPVAKKRGRPAGTKNKPKETAAAPAAPAAKKRGRPAGTKNKPKAETAPAAKPAAKAPTKKAAAKKAPAKAPAAEAPVAKKRGRPAGSKNKAKEAAAEVKTPAKAKTGAAAFRAAKTEAKKTAKASGKTAAKKAPAKQTAAKKPAAKAPSAKAAPAKAAGKKTGGAVPKARFS